MKALVEKTNGVSLPLPSHVESDKEAALKKSAFKILQLIGEDTERQGLKQTPERFAKALGFLASGYREKTEDLVGDAIFDEPESELVLVRDIEFYSLCEHHMLPFFGKAHVAYLPAGKVIGLSKIPRIVDVFARRLQVQERLTRQIAEEIQRLLMPRGVAVFIEASHLCMMMRGVEKQGCMTTTKATLGEFKTNREIAFELMALLKK